MKFPGKLVPPTAAHIAELAETMRDADVAEVWAAGHMTPIQALNHSVLGSRDTNAWIVNDRVISIFGIGSHMALTDHTVPWLLASRYVRDFGKPFLRGGKLIAEEWKRGNPRMKNYVDARHTDAIRWIGWLGFEIKPVIPFGPEGMPFHPFEWSSECASSSPQQ
jgi:hypothetical protein